MNIEVSDIALPLETMLNQRYQIKEVYYLGQFGIVYFGMDAKTKQDVVIKEFMPYNLANRDMDGRTVICRSKGCSKQYKQAKEAFLRECGFVKKLRNVKKPYEKCIVPYLDSFSENGTYYLITERVIGTSLQDFIENGEDFSVRDTMKMLVAIVRQIHKKGIVHCDIKPSNIILREDGRIVLIDFGSACDEKCKDNSMVFVSRGFSAPELYHGGRIDRRTDIYSIGAVLYYMLTDYQLPEPDDYDEQEEIPRISEFVEIPAHLEKIILKTLNRNKKNRPSSLLLLQIILKL